MDQPDPPPEPKQCNNCRADVDGSRTFVWKDVYACSDECYQALSDMLDSAGN